MMAVKRTIPSLMAMSLAGCLLVVGTSCHEADSSPEMRPTERVAQPEQVKEVASDGKRVTAGAEARPQAEGESAKQLLARLPDYAAPPWLAVLAASATGPGGWATASFDAKRNRVTIDTHDVEAFSIDTSRLAVRWDRLVIVRINGRNAELVRRKNPVIRLERDAHRQWGAAKP